MAKNDTKCWIQQRSKTVFSTEISYFVHAHINHTIQHYNKCIYFALFFCSTRDCFMDLWRECIMNPFWHTFVFVTWFFFGKTKRVLTNKWILQTLPLTLLVFYLFCEWFYQLNDNETVKFKQELRITTILTDCSALFCLLRWPIRCIVIN